MKRTFKVSGALAASLLMMGYATPILAETRNGHEILEYKSHELEDRVNQLKELGVNPGIERTVIKKIVHSGLEMLQARSDIESAIAKVDKANENVVNIAKAHKESVKKEQARLQSEEEDIKSKFPLIMEKEGVRIYGQFNEEAKGSHDYYKNIHIFFDADSDYEGAVDGVRIYDDSKWEVVSGDAKLVGNVSASNPDWDYVALGGKGSLPAEGTTVKLTHVATLDDGRSVDMLIKVGKFRTKTDDKPEFIQEYMSYFPNDKRGEYLLLGKTTNGSRQMSIESAFGKQTQLDIQFVDGDGNPVKLVTGLVSTDIDYLQSVTVGGNAWLGNLVPPKSESGLDTIIWDADRVPVPNTVKDVEYNVANGAESIPRGSFVSLLAGDSFSYTHGEWNETSTQGDAFREKSLNRVKEDPEGAGLPYMYTDIFGTGSKVHVHKPDIPTQPANELNEVVGEIEVVNYTRYEDEDGRELAEKQEGIHDHKLIPEYDYIRTDRAETGDVTHVYSKIHYTSYLDEIGQELLPKEKGILDKKEIDEHEFVRTNRTPDGNIEHIYRRIKHTYYLDENHKEILTQKEGIHDKENIDGYDFVQTIELENGDVEHLYSKIKWTSYIDENGKNLLEAKKGLHEKESVSGYNFLRTVNKESGNIEHVYTRIKWTSYVDTNGLQLIPKREGTLDKEEINDYDFVRTDIKDDGDIEHVYSKIKWTSYVDENDSELLTKKKGIHDRESIDKYNFVRTVLDVDGNVKHVYSEIKWTTYVGENERRNPRQGGN